MTRPLFSYFDGIPLELTEQEQQDVVAMLKSLNGEGWQHVTAPTAFPK